METQEQQQEITSSVYDPIKDSFDTVQLRLDPSITLEKIRYSLLRHKYNPLSQTWEKQNLEPLLSEDGVQDIMIELEARMSVDKVLGNIRDKEYNLILREIGEAVLEFLYFNNKVYNIKEADLSRIFYIITHNVRIFLSRARGGIENLYLSKQFQYRDVQTRRGDTTYKDQQPQTNSALSLFGRRGR